MIDGKHNHRSQRGLAAATKGCAKTSIEEQRPDRRDEQDPECDFPSKATGASNGCHPGPACPGALEDCHHSRK